MVAPDKQLPTPLLLRASWRFFARHRWQSGLTLLGIMIGVAVVVAVDLANNSARRAFALSLETVSGRASHYISGGERGIDEAFFVDLRRQFPHLPAAPAVSASVQLEEPGPRQTVNLLGLDIVGGLDSQTRELRLPEDTGRRLLLQPHSALLSARNAMELGVQAGDTLTLGHRGRQQTVHILAPLQSENPALAEGLLLTDISSAQTLLDRTGVIDRIDLQLDEADVQRLRAWLPDHLQLVASERREHTLLQMTEAFHINLTAMSLLALLVGALLIYNAMRFSVLQRRDIIGTYRSLGLTRREIFSSLLVEALLLGAIGTAMGLLAGTLLAQALVQLVTRTIDDLYFALTLQQFFFSGASLIKGLVLGIGVTLAAAWLPAWEATRTPAVTVQRRSSAERRPRYRHLAFLLVSILLFSAGWWLAQRPAVTLLEGFVALGLLIAGFSLAVPPLLYSFTRSALLLGSPLLGLIPRMAIRGVYTNLSRTGLAVAALTVAVATTVGVGTMVQSFRHTLDLWLSQTLAGDIYLSRPSSGTQPASIAPALIEQLRTLPGVDAINRSHRLTVESAFGPLPLLVQDPHRHSRQGLPLKSAVAGAARAFTDAQGLFISEPLAAHHDIAAGDHITLATAAGRRQLAVLGIIYDYRSSRGLAVIPRPLYRSLWQDNTVTGITLYGQPPGGAATVRALAAQYDNILVRTQRDIHQRALAVFDQTFAITDVLRLLTIIVACVGIISALMALQLEKLRELALLRATGMLPGEIRRLVLLQSGVMGIAAGVLALPLGIVMADILIDVINRRAFGWSMQHSYPPTVFVEALGLALAAALLAAAVPALRAARVAPAKGLRDE